MIVVPPHLVTQWSQEIKKCTKAFKVWLYHGDARDPKLRTSHRVLDDLTQSHPMFSEDTPGQNIVITSYQTLTQRHGPKLQLGWQVENNRPITRDETDLDWPKCLANRFGVVVCDEVHSIRNMDTQGFRTIQWLKAAFYVLLSATPAFNSVADLKGMLSLMINPENDLWWKSVDLPKDYNPITETTQNPDDPRFRLLFTHRGIKQWIWNNPNMEATEQAMALQPIWKMCVIRRLVTSRIPLGTGPLIGSHIPPAMRKIVSVQFSPQEQDQYNFYSAEPRRKLVFFHERTGKHMWRADKYRILVLLGTWLGSQYVQDALMAKDTEKNVRKLDAEGSLGKWLVHRALKKNHWITSSP